VGVRDERVDDLYLQPLVGDPTEEGQVRNTGTDIKAFVGGSVHSLITGSGISSAQHRFLDQLVHDIDESSYFELTRSGGQVTVATWWTDNTKTIKIRETTITRSSGQVATIVAVQYDGAGAVVETMTGTVNRSAGQVSNIEWVRT